MANKIARTIGFISGWIMIFIPEVATTAIGIGLVYWSITTKEKRF
jgi:hypothetical protein